MATMKKPAPKAPMPAGMKLAAKATPMKGADPDNDDDAGANESAAAEKAEAKPKGRAPTADGRKFRKSGARVI